MIATMYALAVTPWEAIPVVLTVSAIPCVMMCAAAMCHVVRNAMPAALVARVVGRLQVGATVLMEPTTIAATLAATPTGAMRTRPQVGLAIYIMALVGRIPLVRHRAI